MTRVAVLAISCSPKPGGRTFTVLEEVLRGTAEAGASTEMLELGNAIDLAQAVAALERAEAFVFGSPMYRASYAAPFKALLDLTPRGMLSETSAPLTGHAVATIATAASSHHFLGAAAMRNILVDFFAAHVVSPGVFVTHDAFDDEHQLQPAVAARARSQGRALVELAVAIRTSTALCSVTPIA